MMNADITAQAEQIVGLIINAWKNQNKQVSQYFSQYPADLYASEIAPGRNRASYLLGHLIAVNDGMIPLFGFGEKLFPDLEEIFLRNPDRAVSEVHSIDQLKAYWERLNQTLQAHFDSMSVDQWLDRHTAVSPEDFALTPSRNKLNVLLSRTTHQAYHIGQLKLLKGG
jgi:uncharacterized damage-inducible protein DinB